MDKTCIVLWRQGVSLNTTFVCSIQLMLNNTFQTQSMKYGLINANLVTKWTITSSELVLHRKLWFTTERLNFRSITVWKIAQKTITANWKIRQTPAINSVLQRIVDPMVVCVCVFFSCLADLTRISLVLYTHDSIQGDFHTNFYIAVKWSL